MYDRYRSDTYRTLAPEMGTAINSACIHIQDRCNHSTHDSHFRR